MSQIVLSQKRKRPRYASVVSVPAGASAMVVERRKRRRPGAYSVAKGGELKYVDTVSISGTISTTLFVTPLNIVMLGDDPKDRNGKAIMVRSIHIRGKLFLNGDVDASAHDFLRMLVVYDRQSNNAAPTWGSVMTSVNAGNGTTTTSYSFRNQDNTDRYQILCDRCWGADVLVANAATTAASQSKQAIQSTPQDIDFYRKVNLPTRYSANGGTISDIASGAILLMFLGKNTAATSAWSFEGESRIRFSDQTK